MIDLMQRIGANLRHFRDDRRGVSAVEFGLVGVPFVGLLLAIFETGLVLLSGVSLQGAVQTGARNMLTGNAQAQGTTVYTAAAFNSTYICPVLPSYIPCSGLITDVRTVTDFANASTSSDFYKTGQKFCPGAPGDITVVRVAYAMPVYLPLLAVASGGATQITNGLVNDVPNNPGWKHLLVATIVYRTERYDSANYSLANYTQKGASCP